MNNEKGSFIIVKDLPCDSPLLSDDENKLSKSLMSSLEENGFIVISGQALAYVPINFASTEEYLQKFSKSRRRDFKRKLRSFSEISVEAMKTGDDFFVDTNVELLYQLFLNTYKHSSIHFDKLTLSFFRKVLKDDSSDGIVFLYRNREGIIGFNLCFIYKNCLVDKYIGFRYPEARKHNLYYLSWFHNLDFCIKNKFETFIAGWTDPEIKAYLGAEFTSTKHAVYVKNPLLRFCLKRVSGFFESDKRVLKGIEPDKHP
jgi:predicted N-acyltransferase